MNLIDALFIVTLNFPLVNMDAKDCAAVFDKNCVCSPSLEMIKKEFNLKYEKIEFDRKYKINSSFSVLDKNKTQVLVINN